MATPAELLTQMETLASQHAGATGIDMLNPEYQAAKQHYGELRSELLAHLADLERDAALGRAVREALYDTTTMGARYYMLRTADELSKTEQFKNLGNLFYEMVAIFERECPAENAPVRHPPA